MTDRTSQSAARGGRTAGGTDLGKRIAARRHGLGLTREQVSERVGSAPGYLAYVEEGEAVPGMPFLLRLADVLETTLGGLTGLGLDRAPGASVAYRHGELEPLPADTCLSLLSTHGIGRIGIQSPGGPAVVPVNYLIARGTVAYRTAPGSFVAEAADHEAVFEADHIDDVWRQGWSVNIVGMVHAAEEDEARSLDDMAYTLPWAGEDRRQWMVLVPDRITGRRVRTV